VAIADGGTADEQPAAEDRSLADELAAAFEASTKPETADAAEGTAAAETPKPGEGEGEARARDEHGRFAKAGEKAEKPEGDKAKPEAAAEGDGKPKAEEKPKPADGKQPDAAAEKTATGAAPEAPANWSAKDKQMLKEIAEKAGPAHAQFILDRHKAMEADYTRKTQEIAEVRNEYGPVHQMFQPHMQRLKAAGYTPRTLIQAWASVENELMSGDAKRQLGVVRNIVTMYKLDPAAVVAALGSAGAAPQPGGDGVAKPGEIPAVLKPWMEELQGVKGWIGAEERRRQQENEQRQQEAERQRQAQLGEITTSIENFRTAADASGQLLHPYFADVERDMVVLANAARISGQKLTLDELYDRAVHANPTVRAKALAAAQAAQRVKTEAEARARATQARKAGSSVTGAPHAGQTPRATPPKDASLRETLDAAYRDSLGE
jgi:hypothetical protein